MTTQELMTSSHNVTSLIPQELVTSSDIVMNMTTQVMTSHIVMNITLQKDIMMISPEGELSMEDYTAYKVGRGLYLYLSPIMMIIGLIGNCLSFAVLSRKVRYPSPTCLYLSVLAVVDTIALYVPCVRGWLVHITQYDLMVLMGCSWYFIVYFSFANISVYIIFNMTVDRFIYVMFPFAAKTICTHKRAVLGMAGTSLLQVLFNLHYPWAFQATTITDGNQTIQTCTPSPGYEHWMNKVWPYLDLGIYSFIPFTVLTTLNIIIICRTVHQFQHVKDVSAKQAFIKQKGTSICIYIFAAILCSLHS